MKIVFLAPWLATSVCLQFFACVCDSSAKKITPAQKLALIDKVYTNDVKVKTMDTLIQRLSVKYDECKDTIAVWTARGQVMLKANDIAATNLEILHDMDSLAMDSAGYDSGMFKYLIKRTGEWIFRYKR